jgi:hypothetical protein
LTDWPNKRNIARRANTLAKVSYGSPEKIMENQIRRAARDDEADEIADAELRVISRAR